MSKKVISILLAFLLLVVAAGCGTGKEPVKPTAGPTGSSAESVSPTESASHGTETSETEGTKTPEDPKEAGNCSDLMTDSRAFAVVDDDGNLFLGKNMYESYRPASITKVLTALVTVESVSLDNRVTIPEKAVTEHLGILSSGVRPSFKPGETVTVRDLLYALILPSTNAAGNILAFYVAGSIEAFTDLMNEKVRELGLTHSHFVNPHGLDENGHLTCAYDMAVILKEALKHDELKKIMGTLEYAIPATEYTGVRYTANTHAILDGRYPLNGAYAGKPGYTNGAKSTLLTAVERGGKRFYICTMYSDEGHCYTDTQNIAEYAYARYNGTKTNLKTFGHDIELIEEDESGITIRYSIANKSTEAYVAYWDMRRGVGTAQYFLNVATGANQTLRIPISAKGIYTVGVSSIDSTGKNLSSQANIIFDGKINAPGVTTWNGQVFFLDERGFLKTGAIETSEGCYYAYADGSLGKGFIGQYYAGADYKLVSGWIETGGCKFYAQADGRLAKGLLIVDGVLYQFSDNGMLLGSP